MQFRNHYHCAECGCEWTGVWSAQCDDDCPHCGARHFLTVGDPSQVKQLSQQDQQTYLTDPQVLNSYTGTSAPVV